jgi:hypothetical protein
VPGGYTEETAADEGIFAMSPDGSGWSSSRRITLTRTTAIVSFCIPTSR